MGMQNTLILGKKRYRIENKNNYNIRLERRICYYTDCYYICILTFPIIRQVARASSIGYF